MSKTSERLDNYITQMQEQADQHSMILASDVMVMLEQLKDDLKDDTDNIIAKLEEERDKLETDIWARENDNWYGEYCNGMSEGYGNVIDMVKRGDINEPTENKETDTR